MQVRTPHARRKLARDKAIGERYAALMAMPGAMRSQVISIIMREFRVKSSVTIYATLNREAARKAALTL